MEIVNLWPRACEKDKSPLRDPELIVSHGSTGRAGRAAPSSPPLAQARGPDDLWAEPEAIAESRTGRAAASGRRQPAGAAGSMAAAVSPAPPAAPGPKFQLLHKAASSFLPPSPGAPPRGLLPCPPQPGLALRLVPPRCCQALGVHLIGPVESGALSLANQLRPRAGSRVRTCSVGAEEQPPWSGVWKRRPWWPPLRRPT